MDKSNLGIFLIAFAIVLLVVAGRIDWLATLLPCGIVVLFIGARSRRRQFACLVTRKSGRLG
jgi:uncharacterized membrane protein YfcA